MTVLFLDPAEDEFAEAIAYYDARSRGLGDRFAEAVESQLRKICDLPKAAAEIDQGFRRRLVPNYPYSVIYEIIGEQIVIHAVAHQSRRPGYWRGRSDRP